MGVSGVYVWYAHRCVFVCSVLTGVRGTFGMCEATKENRIWHNLPQHTFSILLYIPPCTHTHLVLSHSSLIFMHRLREWALAFFSSKKICI